jgi:hypothetical protein
LQVFLLSGLFSCLSYRINIFFEGQKLGFPTLFSQEAGPGPQVFESKHQMQEFEVQDTQLVFLVHASAGQNFGFLINEEQPGGEVLKHFPVSRHHPHPGVAPHKPHVTPSHVGAAGQPATEL